MSTEKRSGTRGRAFAETAQNRTAVPFRKRLDWACLLELDLRANSFELGLEGFRIFLGNAFLDLGRNAFDQSLGIGQAETGDLDFPSVREYLRPPVADGVVSNEAGILHMRGTITAEMLCVCDRCGQEFESTKETAVDAVLVEEESEDNPELFVLEGTEIDAQEVLSTCFILDMETKFLCREDCKGLCARCGKNLNLGPCGCGKEIDPRFAVLEQLLDKSL